MKVSLLELPVTRVCREEVARAHKTLRSVLVCFVLPLSHVRSTSEQDKVRLNQARSGWLTIC